MASEPDLKALATTGRRKNANPPKLMITANNLTEFTIRWDGLTCILRGASNSPIWSLTNTSTGDSKVFQSDKPWYLLVSDIAKHFKEE